MHALSEAEVLSDGQHLLAVEDITLARPMCAHSHGFAQVSLVRGGRADQHTEEGVNHLDTNTIVVLSPGSWHSYDPAPTIDLTNLYLSRICSPPPEYRICRLTFRHHSAKRSTRPRRTARSHLHHHRTTTRRHRGSLARDRRRAEEQHPRPARPLLPAAGHNRPRPPQSRHPAPTAPSSRDFTATAITSRMRLRCCTTASKPGGRWPRWPEKSNCRPRSSSVPSGSTPACRPWHTYNASEPNGWRTCCAPLTSASRPSGAPWGGTTPATPAVASPHTGAPAPPATALSLDRGVRRGESAV